MHLPKARLLYLLIQNIGVVLLLEPVDGLLLVGLVQVADDTSGSLSSGNTVTVTAHDNVEVHTVDTNTWVVLDTQVDVLVDTETKVTGGTEVSSLQLELLDSETSLQDLLGLGASDGHVHRDLLVSSDTESSDSVSGLGLDWRLTGQLLQHLGGTGQSVTGLSDTDVQDQLLDTQLTHRVLGGHFGLFLLWVGEEWKFRYGFFFSTRCFDARSVQCLLSRGSRAVREGSSPGMERAWLLGFNHGGKRKLFDFFHSFFSIIIAVGHQYRDLFVTLPKLVVLPWIFKMFA